MTSVICPVIASDQRERGNPYNSNHMHQRMDCFVTPLLAMTTFSALSLRAAKGGVAIHTIKNKETTLK